MFCVTWTGRRRRGARVIDRPFRVLHVAASDGGEGGAAKAARSVHAALRSAGHDSRMLVRRKLSDDEHVAEVAPLTPWQSRRRRAAARLRPPAPLPDPTATFNFDLPQDFDERSLLGAETPDVVLVHRTTRFLTVRQLALLEERYRRPLVWLLHDQFPVTGGCHFSLDCDGFERTCGRCPQLHSSDPNDRTHELWLRKQRSLAGLPITFVGQSREALRWVERSSLFGGRRAELIRQPIDVDIFRPLDRSGARDLLRIPQEARVVLLGSYDLRVARKGTRCAVEALRLLDDELRRDLWVLAVGKYPETLAGIDAPLRWVGVLHDDVALAPLYAAADVFVSPSLADSGPMMVAEALLCGRPVVAFSIGLAADLVGGEPTGRLAAPGDVQGLADGIASVLRAGPDGSGDECRAAAADCAPARVAAAYAELFRSLSAGGGAPPPAPRAAA